MLSGVPTGVSKHPSFINGCGFAAARTGLDMYPPRPRFRREYAPFMNDDRCVPVGTPKRSKAKKKCANRRKLGSCKQL
jgi:hypothetical protein